MEFSGGGLGKVGGFRVLVVLYRWGDFRLVVFLFLVLGRVVIYLWSWEDGLLFWLGLFFIR